MFIAVFAGCLEDVPQRPFVDTTDAAPCDQSDAGVRAELTPGVQANAPQVERNGRGDVMVTWTGAGPNSLVQNLFALSHDEGITFPTMGNLPEASAAWATVASDGTNFYVAALTGSGVFVHRIDPSNGAVGPAVRVSRTTGQPGAFSAPTIAVHNDGTIAVAYGDSYEGLVVARSTDQASTFTSVGLSVAGAEHSRFCIDRAAGMNAAWVLVSQAGSSFSALLSADRGATWPNLLYLNVGNAAEQFPGCAVRGNDVWLALPTGTTAADAIAILHSADGGASFGNSVLAARNELFLDPAFAITDAGTLELLYYAGVPGDRARLVLARSNDGISFHCTELADAGPLPSSRAVLGDLLGLALGGGHLFAAYADDIGQHPAVDYLRLDEP